MTSVLEKIIAFIAPHHCLVCGNENNILCDACAETITPPIASFCVYCYKPTTDWLLCEPCQKISGLTYVWVAGEFEGLLAKVIKKFKFGGGRAADQPLAQLLADRLPYLSSDWRIVYVPTVPGRARERGYDHAELLARQLGRVKNVPVVAALRRRTTARQLGATRTQRQKQMADAFYVTKPDDLKGKKVLLVDDVCTTGATISAAAKTLYDTGCVSVHGAVIAWKSPKSD